MLQELLISIRDALAHPLPIVLLALWFALMASVPILTWIKGENGRKLGISLTVLAQAALSVAFLAGELELPMLLVTIAGIPAFGWLSEFAGSQTGLPFGRYHYTDVLQPQIGHVPVIIPLAWLMMIPASWAMAGLLPEESPRLVKLVVAALSFTAWDLYLDPQMVGWKFWEWEQDGAYFGIPVINYVGWFLVAFLISALLMPVGFAAPGLVAVYLLTWVMQLVAQVFFWNLKGPAVFGFLGMGACVVLVLVL